MNAPAVRLLAVLSLLATLCGGRLRSRRTGRSSRRAHRNPGTASHRTSASYGDTRTHRHSCTSHGYTYPSSHRYPGTPYGNAHTLSHGEGNGRSGLSRHRLCGVGQPKTDANDLHTE
jgi:hypothetical protein